MCCIGGAVRYPTQVAVVTGGNAGIGFATAQALARRGCHVVLACRDPQRAQAAVEVRA
jgi:WW domain-containing oxidoreductase